MTRSSAVDEGRNPYGQPGRGNGDRVWQLLNEVPCPKCGASGKSLLVERDRATVTCRSGVAQR